MASRGAGTGLEPVERANVIGGKLAKPRPPQRALEVEFQMVEPVGHLDQGRAPAERSTGDANAVRGGAETDLLVRGPSRMTTEANGCARLVMRRVRRPGWPAPGPT